MSILTITKPSVIQVQHGIERVLGVFTVAFLGQWALTGYTLHKTAFQAAALAGATEVWQLVVGVTTTNL